MKLKQQYNLILNAWYSGPINVDHPDGMYSLASFQKVDVEAFTEEQAMFLSTKILRERFKKFLKKHDAEDAYITVRKFTWN